MNNSRLYIFTLLLGFALVGLLWIQFLWINNAVIQSTKDFDSDVRKAISTVAKKIEEDSYCVYFHTTKIIPSNHAFSLVSANEDGLVDTIPFSFRRETEKGMDVLRFNSLSFENTIKIEHEMKVVFITDSIQSSITNAELDAFYQERDLGTIDTSSLYSSLKKEFLLNGIDAEFELTLLNQGTQKMIYSSQNDPFEPNSKNTYKHMLFEGSSFNHVHTLSIQFPHKQLLIWKSLWLTIISSVVLLMVLIFLFLSFLKMVYSLKKLNDMRMDFINGMTHEFRTPVSNITLAINALKRKSLEPTDLKYIEIIEEEKDRLYKGIDIVLTSALIEKQELAMNKEQVDISALITCFAKNNELNILIKKAQLTLELSENCPLIYLDKHHFVNVLENLMNNALLYSEVGVQIKINCQRIGNGIEILFIDNGHGIAAENIKHIFDKFYRVSTQNRYEAKGYGIGLYYVKMIIEAHQGTISVQSTLYKGSIFKIYLPI